MATNSPWEDVGVWRAVAFQGATLEQGATATLYLPTAGTWQFDIDGKAYATETRLEAWNGCPLTVDVIGDGSISWVCAD